MHLLKLGLVAATLLLIGCNTADSGPYGGGAGVAVGAALPASYSPVGRLVVRGSDFVPEGGGYAVVVLKPGSPSRNLQACNRFRQSMGPVLTGPADGRPIILDGTLVYERPVYWPVRTGTARNCTAMLQNYDFQRAAATLPIRSGPSVGRGPFVVVRKANGSQAGLFDFSNVVKGDFDEQFAAVVNYMSRRPDVWSASFYHPATFRQRMRYYVLERAGQGPLVIASLVNLSGN